VTVPESVAPVTCECTETARVKLKITTINDTTIFLIFRKHKPSIRSLLNDHANIVEACL
jgi:hypothetical protein